jgi:hypothetical protein
MFGKTCSSESQLPKHMQSASSYKNYPSHGKCYVQPREKREKAQVQVMKSDSEGPICKQEN